MNRIKLFPIGLFTLLLVSLAGAQVTPGVPNFSAYSTHEIDTINLMDNNIITQLPGWKKGGAIPLSFTTFPNNFYMSVTSVNNTWAPPQALALMSSIGPRIYGFVYNPNSTVNTSGVPCNVGFTTEYTSWIIKGPDGTVHALPSSFWIDSSGCFRSSATGTTIDGSGLTLTGEQ